MDVPSPEAGRVGALNVKVGDRVSAGNVILSLETEDGADESGDGAHGGRGEPTAAPLPRPATSPRQRPVRRLATSRPPQRRRLRQPPATARRASSPFPTSATSATSRSSRCS